MSAYLPNSNTRPAPSETDEKLSFALLAGGGLKSWVWQPVSEQLSGPHLAIDRHHPDLAGSEARIEDCVSHAVQCVDERLRGPVVLVAHSMAGIFAERIRRARPERIRHIVYLAANVPAPGKTATSNVSWFQGFQLGLFARLTHRGLRLPEAKVREFQEKQFAHDLDKQLLERVIAEYVQDDAPLSLIESALSATDTPTPSSMCSYIVTTDDRGLLTPARQHKIAETLGARVYELDCSHTAMLARPFELASILNRIAEGL